MDVKFRLLPAALALSAAIINPFNVVNASAQSLAITSPSSTVTVKEGDDYASTVLNNPWDFNERRDIAWEEKFDDSTIKITSGVWSGKSSGNGSYIFPLFGGFAGALSTKGLDGDTSLPKAGIDAPLKTSKYKYLSYKLNNSARSSFALYWKNDTNGTYWPDGTDYVAAYDGIYHGGRAFANSGYRIYNYDMSNLALFDAHTGAWNNDIISFRIDPSLSDTGGATTQLDWIRIVDPTSAPYQTISWNSSSLSAGNLIQVFMDNNNSGYDGYPLAYFSDGSNPGSYTFPTAMLPPGTYYFYVRSSKVSGSSLVTEATSGYSAKLVVTKAPAVVFNSPTQISGTDYATSEVGDPWDMSSSTDIANLTENSTLPDEWRQFSSPSFANGVFQAVANPPINGATETDVQVHMNVSKSKPIDTSKYRYLTYRMAVDATLYPTISDKIEKGWVSRPVYWDLSLFGDGGRAKAHPIYEGYHTYTIDLWDSGMVEAGLGWKGNSYLSNLRIDPLETPTYTWFFLDWVKLTAEPRDESGRFDISWDIADSDSSSFTASLYYDTDNSGFNGTLITTLSGLSAGANSYRWNTSGFSADSTLYVYIVVSDGTNTRKFYAPSPVRTGTYTPTPQKQLPPLDYDGDGKSDQVVFRNGLYFINQSIIGPNTIGWGTALHTPVPGDYDGDGREDYGAVVNNGGFLHWYVFKSTDAGLYYQQWGLVGDKLVPADYNGDGKTDVAVYRAGTWYILYDTGAVAVVGWGLDGDVPVPSDYDGDGKADIAIWRPSTGDWWILNSGFGAGGLAADYYSVIQWGLDGDIPLPGDFDGDGRSDTAVWRPWNGTWYMKTMDNQEIEMAQWGLPGDTPMIGDYNGDGLLDFTVWRSSTGTWYHNYRNNQTAAVQWGLPGDRLPMKQ